MGWRETVANLLLRRIKDAGIIRAAAASSSDITAQGRYSRRIDAEWIQRYCNKWVMICASRTASGVASIPLIVCRKTKGKQPKKSSFRSHAMDPKKVKRLKAEAGYSARKHLGDADSIEIIDDDLHPLKAIIDRPNPDMNGYDWVESTQLGMELAGHGFNAIVQATSSEWPTELHVLPPQFVRWELTERGEIKRWMFAKQIGKEIPIEPEDMIQYKFPNPYGDPVAGLPPIAACLIEADASSELVQYTKSVLENGGVPGMVVTAPGLTKDTAKQMEEDLTRRRSGVNNAGANYVVWGRDVAVSWPNVNNNPVLKEAENQLRDGICAVWGMPIGAVNMEEMSLANGKVVLPHWQVISLLPRLRRIEDKLNEKLVPRFREALRDDGLFVVGENPVDEDRAAVVLEVTQLLPGQAVISVNEGREMLGLPPMEGEENNKLPKPIAFGVDGGDGSGDTGDRTPPKTGKDAGRTRRLDPGAFLFLRGAKTWTQEFFGRNAHICHETRPRTKSAGEDIVLNSEQLEQVIRSFLDMLIPKVQHAVGDDGSIAVQFMDSQPIIDAFSAAVAPQVSPLFAQGFTLGADEAAMTVDAAALTSSAREFLSHYVPKLADSVMNTQAAHVSAAVSESIGQGASVTQIQQNVAQTLRTDNPYTAERIARSEANRAYAHGRDAAWEDSGIVEQKEWLLSGNPCNTCRAIHRDRRFVKVGEPFVKVGETVNGIKNTYAPIMGSDAHPQCNCGVGAVFVREVEDARA